MVSYMSKLYDIVSYAKKTVYKDGVCTYLGDIDGNGYTLSVYARSKLPAVEYSLKFDNNIMPQTIFTVNTPRNFSSEYKNGLWVYKNMKHTPVEFCGFIKCSSAKHKSFSDSARLFGGADAGKNDIMAISCNQNKVIFAIGGVSREKQVFEVAKRCAVKDKQEEAMEFVKSQTPDIVLNTGNSGLDSLFSKFAPYQAAISRFYGKTGFYQTGGAYGFRDQLQDCFCLIYSNPKAVRTHLLRCAAHQYREGDVMHWWFKSEKCDTGIRTKCSDDFLFLPLALSNYVEKTGDTDILQIQIPYMESPPLESGERYETPSVSPYKESVYMHCIRAMANGEKTGAHGLSLMGSCDWNDGMSKIGALGRGESVFTSFLYVYTCKKFIPIMKLMNDTVSLSHFASISASLVMALEQYTFEGDRYIRAFDDNGIAVGSKSSNECKIDILSQAFAAMVLGKTERTQKAMESAINRLFSRKDKLLMLFTPPFDKYDAGYISSYCKGVRENGGQYTHGALWGVLGLIKCGKLAEALEVLSAIMPFSHSNEEIYRVEPYVIAADIYSGEKAGRGGWTWYTGSASWFFVIMLEEILGIHFTNAFKTVEITPITDYSLTLSLPSGKLSVTVSPLFSETTLNGKKASFPLDIPVGDNVLQVKTVINK